MFIAGLPVKKAGFSSRLVIDPNRGPIYEILEHDDGSRTVINAVSPPEYSMPVPRVGVSSDNCRSGVVGWFIE